MYLTNSDKWQEVEEEFFASIKHTLPTTATMAEELQADYRASMAARRVFRFLSQHFEPPEPKMRPEASF